MNAYARNEKIKRALGIKAVEWQKNEGHTATWRVIRENGEKLIIKTHCFATDTGVLREAAKLIPIPRY